MHVQITLIIDRWDTEISSDRLENCFCLLPLISWMLSFNLIFKSTEHLNKDIKISQCALFLVSTIITKTAPQF